LACRPSGHRPLVSRDFFLQLTITVFKERNYFWKTVSRSCIFNTLL
jgi:hypothetical protein